MFHTDGPQTVGETLHILLPREDQNTECVQPSSFPHIILL